MEIGEKFNIKLIENYIRDYHENPQIKDAINSFINNDRNFSKIIGYVDGPPTMNGEPHLGHL
ncbi:MAG TPA: hypothetical protein VFX18_01260, partial [Candidatus Nitrosocosmicus sp.]|nr:hypothetical protein [Candidatus Nitrosocosmicus sp.]